MRATSKHFQNVKRSLLLHLKDGVGKEQDTPAHKTAKTLPLCTPLVPDHTSSKKEDEHKMLVGKLELEKSQLSENLLAITRQLTVLDSEHGMLKEEFSAVEKDSLFRRTAFLSLMDTLQSFMDAGSPAIIKLPPARYKQLKAEYEKQKEVALLIKNAHSKPVRKLVKQALSDEARERASVQFKTEPHPSFAVELPKVPNSGKKRGGSVKSLETDAKVITFCDNCSQIADVIEENRRNIFAQMVFEWIGASELSKKGVQKAKEKLASFEADWTKLRPKVKSDVHIPVCPICVRFADEFQVKLDFIVGQMKFDPESPTPKQRDECIQRINSARVSIANIDAILANTRELSRGMSADNLPPSSTKGL